MFDISAESAVVVAFFGSVCFATSSFFYAKYSKQVSTLWMNFFKCLVSTICCLFAVLLLEFPEARVFFSQTNLFLFLSGIFGLCIADFFLLRAFIELGNARTFLIYSFQPLIVGTGSYFLFNQPLHLKHFLGIAAFMGCVCFISLEQYKKSGSWQLKWIGIALCGLIIDCSSVLMAKAGFESNPALTPITGSLIRSVGALFFFFLIHLFWKKIDFWKHYHQLKPSDRLTSTIASFTGTFLSLILWLTALRVGHVASVAAVGASSPFVASLVEFIFFRKKVLSKYFIAAFACFVLGFYILHFNLNFNQHFN